MKRKIKPLFYYSVMTSNRGDMAIRKSITEGILDRLDVPFAFFHVRYDELTEKRIQKQLNIDCSGLMVAGSGLYTNYPSCSSGWYFPCKTELFESIKVPIFLIGLGCNNNLGNDIFQGELKAETKDSIRLINQLSQISTVRDKRTFDILQSIGVKNHQLMLDPANFLKVKNSYIKRKRVAINIAQHSPELGRWDGDGGIRQQNLNHFEKICNHLHRNSIEVIFIAHDPLEESLIRDLRQKCPFLLSLNTDNIDEMLSEYSRCLFSIAVKMHSNIMSFASGTPFISVYYDVKSPEYIKMLDIKEDIGISIFENYSDWVINKCDYFLENIFDITKKVNIIKSQKQDGFNSLMENVCNIIQTIN